MEETKPWWQSKSIIGSALVIVVLVLRLLGRPEAEVVEAETEGIASWWLEAIALVGGLLAFIGRLTAKKELTK